MILNFELVPDGCWYSNLRTCLKKSQWDILRKNAYAKAEGKCCICKAKTSRLEAHERWSYNMQTKVQKLEEIIAVCHLCHSVIHIGRTQLIGDEEKAIKHFIKVNKCSYVDYRKALGEANELHKKRNEIEWMLDASILKDLLGEMPII